MKMTSTSSNGSDERKNALYDDVAKKLKRDTNAMWSDKYLM